MTEQEREKYRIAASVLCGAHIGVPQGYCPVCKAESLLADLDKAAERERAAGEAGASVSLELAKRHTDAASFIYALGARLAFLTHEVTKQGPLALDLMAARSRVEALEAALRPAA